MAVKLTTSMLLTILVLLMANAATSLRDIPKDAEPKVGLAEPKEGLAEPKEGLAEPKLGLAERLQSTEAETNDCWTALSELRQCSNEVVAFFLNGEADLDTPCCNAIEVITRRCWPSMLSVLGFSAEEGTLLAGYCERSSAGPIGAPPVTAANHF